MERRNAMHLAIGLLLLLAAPFWEEKSAEAWTSAEIQFLFQGSPWSQTMEATTRITELPPVPVYLASAEPVRAAEAELLRRRREQLGAGAVTLSEEYLEFLELNRGKVVVLAVSYPQAGALQDAAELEAMQAESRLKAGRQRSPLAGYFPPTPSDPYLRLVFGRSVDDKTRQLEFDLYLPGVPSPFRRAVFRLRDLAYRGAPAF
jgi:hypothetical protein